ncbi:hypothetical protein Tco_0726703 [Tanacetum coccineum]|uniref:Uncharacterized protein n=1 Tax=Tanacetum coccineum TaxID=301880 RepID=A0ABQ4YIN5_9ASTR
MEVNSESNPLERKDAEGPSLDESLENEEHLDVDSCDSDSLRMLNNDSVSLLVGLAWNKNLEGCAGEILGVISHGDCGNVTTDDNEDVRPLLLLKKTPYCASILHRVIDLNLAAGVGFLMRLILLVLLTNDDDTFDTDGAIENPRKYHGFLLPLSRKLRS